jgi:hypothetical protein
VISRRCGVTGFRRSIRTGLVGVLVSIAAASVVWAQAGTASMRGTITEF